MMNVSKVNIDGSFFASTNTGGWGFVLRDSKGQVLAPYDALQTEAVVRLEALQALSD
jgi:ribonuclease HI